MSKSEYIINMNVDDNDMIHEARLPSFYNYNHEMYDELYGGGKNVNPDYGFKYDDEGYYDARANQVKEIMPTGGLRDIMDPRKLITYKFSTFVRALVQEAKAKGIEINDPEGFLLKAEKQFASYFTNENIEKYALETLERSIHNYWENWKELVTDERDEAYNYRPDSWSMTDHMIFNTKPGAATNFFNAEELEEPKNVDIDRMSIPDDHINLGYN